MRRRMVCPQQRHQQGDPPTKLAKRQRVQLVVLLSVFVVVLGVVLIATGTPRGDSSNGGSAEVGKQGNGEEVNFTITPAVSNTTAPTISTPPKTLQPNNIMAPHPSPRPTLSPVVVSPPSAPLQRPVLVLGEMTPVTYRPGELTVRQQGLLLSQGLSVKLIARTGQYVPYGNGGRSSITFHGRPDFGATFEIAQNDFHNPGGWVYTINSEMRDNRTGGVGAITFDKSGIVVDYKMVLTNTTMNCGGGPTPWNTWISCEEYSNGVIFQVDPFGRRSPQVTSFGVGVFESFAYDVRNKAVPRFFATEDRTRGALRRFTPSNPNWDRDPWQMLHGKGALDYLVLHPESKTFEWVSDIDTARTNAAENYPESEGIDVDNGILYFVCKGIKIMTILNLDTFTYVQETTTHGMFDGQPDQIERILGNGTNSDILYFTEEQGLNTGIHGRDPRGRFFTILEGGRDETTGLTFSPNGEHLYFCLQNGGRCFDLTRDDGLPFFGRSLNVKYHNGLYSKL